MLMMDVDEFIIPVAALALSGTFALVPSYRNHAHTINPDARTIRTINTESSTRRRWQ
jgi:hypothetical protein